jgi:hypothetical protein
MCFPFDTVLPATSGQVSQPRHLCPLGGHIALGGDAAPAGGVSPVANELRQPANGTALRKELPMAARLVSVSNVAAMFRAR